ncbi:glycerol-3-phosphate 1-O-acyltransferase PlsY [Ureaplasma parvum]|uniref:glycerol-3-phosphate 1-O-acyltransferase PlsY n=1 Tax=Ureaplasma parvum TaxID=134821 RepID=UPI0026EC4B13|nr:glycerol-3-phosphate 1-O-acyltransferase PlsY [Ureaplasma parvum]
MDQVYNIVMAYILTLIISPLYSYLIGSLNASIILSLVFKKQDVRLFASKNAGMTNMIRVHGKKLGILTLFLDVIKPIITVSLTYIIYKYALDAPFDLSNGFNQAILVYFGGIFTIIGHCYPIFFKFQGGKGVACYGGFLIAVDPIVALIGIITLLVILLITKYMSLSAMITATFTCFLVLVPGINYIPYYNQNFITYFFDLNYVIKGMWYVWFFLLISASLLIYRHKTNILSIATKQERKTILFHTKSKENLSDVNK